MSQGKLLVVEDDAGLREALIDTLLLAGYHCVEVDSGEAALITLNQQKFDMVISDIQMGGMSGLTLLQNIKDKFPTLPVLLMTAYATIDDAVNAIRDGAIDYLAKPFSPEVLMSQVSRYVPVNKVESCTPIYGDASTAKMFKMAEKVAQSDASVMITGPSGSGKEVLSRYLHDQSSRNEQPFIAINCGAIPDSMLESTLFGYEKGAFTGAVQACPGKFEQAQNGTILLDEITEMPLDLQVKLLRVLQEREVERLGSRKTIKLNIRVLATSNRDVKKAVDEGLFREDLYYRLNVFPLQWLPLNKRRGDILPLSEHLLSRHAVAQSQAIPVLTERAKSLLNAYPWPGNVRELDNVMQRALILSDGQKIDVESLILEDIQFEHIYAEEPELPSETEEILSAVTAKDDVEEKSPEPAALGQGLKDQEQKIILEALQNCAGKRKDVAELLGISPRTLRYKLARMKEQGIALPA
ncbi:sigma-54-dependent Fis family transcriptional regulator [Psychromonas sp. psych-6C06]|uniref:sigma-54-dependent transcriptional regulator n=1 Tax=Psychromonas sp. psych-6C06 TaxID=2058089 RepID=UPI000C33EA63|nr:sigma-54 dependent transcriptional regulator [Psychromonas sp. psych-6C06]PKF62888.1 sigma-54-dependent Fis family transcriptional regulator [Psychromonas sp. psych-6C06]